MTTRRGRRIVGVVAVALALLAACEVAEEDYSGNADGPKVSIIGDSITVLAADGLHAELDGTHQSRISAVTGFTWELMREAAEDHAATDPDVAVVNLGSNELTAEPRPNLGEMIASMDELLAVYDDETCVVLVTVRSDGDHEGYDEDLAHAFNEVLRSRSDHRVDWAAAIDPAVHLVDGVHPNEAGVDLLASLVRAGVDDCVGT